MSLYNTQELNETFNKNSLIRSDHKCFETLKILHYYYNFITVNGDNKSKQIYKII